MRALSKPKGGRGGQNTVPTFLTNPVRITLHERQTGRDLRKGALRNEAR